jgi:hypothetical protein
MKWILINKWNSGKKRKGIILKIYQHLVHKTNGFNGLSQKEFVFQNSWKNGKWNPFLTSMDVQFEDVTNLKTRDAIQ